MDERPLGEGYIANFGISSDVLSFCVLDDLFPFFKKLGFLAILGPPYRGIGATIRIGQEMLCFSYAGFFFSLPWKYNENVIKNCLVVDVR